jgi:hypothetical protein
MTGRRCGRRAGVGSPRPAAERPQGRVAWHRAPFRGSAGGGRAAAPSRQARAHPLAVSPTPPTPPLPSACRAPTCTRCPPRASACRPALPSRRRCARRACARRAGVGGAAAPGGGVATLMPTDPDGTHAPPTAPTPPPAPPPQVRRHGQAARRPVAAGGRGSGAPAGPDERAVWLGPWHPGPVQPARRRRRAAGVRALRRRHLHARHDGHGAWWREGVACGGVVPP